MKLTFDVPEEIAEKIGEEIEAALDEYKKSKVFPQAGDKFFFICANGVIGNDIFARYPARDFSMYIFGNCFKKVEEAEFKLEQLKVMHELEQLADNNEEWNIDLPHYYIQYDYEDGWMVDYTYRIKANMFYFQTKEAAQAAIDKIGADRLKKYYFCIPKE